MNEPSPENGQDFPGNELGDIASRLDRLWASQTAASGLLRRRIAQYELERVLGSGAFGVVYLAYDASNRRQVALKVPRPDVLLDLERVERFKTEGTVASSLEHPYIVPIYEAELSSASPYIASAYVPGPNLEQWLSERARGVPPRHAAEFLVKIAEAIHHAHQSGVVHRDLKPSNVLLMELPESLEDSGELDGYVPGITDFGLAKDLENNLTETRSSLMMGTPLYMAPEQFLHDPSGVTARTDVHALGVMLYEMLTLLPPYHGRNYVEIADQIRNHDALPLRKLRSDTPVALENICLKCLEKNPADRYATAEELTADLGRFLSGESVLAKSRSTYSAIWRGIKRNRFAVGLIAVVILLTLAATALWATSRQYQRQAAESVAAQEQTNRDLSRIRYAEQMSKALELHNKRDVVGVQQILDEYAAAGSDTDDFVYRALRSLTDYPKPRILVGHEGLVGEVATRPGHPEQLVSVGGDGTLRIWNWQTGELLKTFQVSPKELYGLAISPDGSHAATGNQFVSTWNLNTGQQERIHAFFNATIEEVDYSPSGRLLASAARFEPIQVTAYNDQGIWSSEDYRNIPSGVGPESLFFLDEGTLVGLVYPPGTRSGRVRSWDITTGGTLEDFPALRNESAYGTTFAPGRGIYAVAGTSNIVLRRLDDHEEIWRFPIFSERACDLQFSPDEQLLAAAGSGGVLRLLHVDTALKNAGLPATDCRSGLTCVPAHYQRITSISFPDEYHVASAGLDGKIKIWKLFDSPDFVIPLDANAYHTTVTANEEHLLTTTKDNHLELRRTDNLQLLWRKPISESPKRAGGLHPPVVSPNGEYCVTCGSDSEARVWDVATGTVKYVFQVEKDVDRAAFSPDAKWLATVNSERTLTVWNLVTGKNDFHVEIVDFGMSVEFSPDGKYLALCLDDPGTMIFSTSDWQLKHQLDSSSGASFLSFCPTREEIATTHVDGSIRFWDLDTGNILKQLRGLSSRKVYVAYHPSGDLLASANLRDGLVLWDLRTSRRLGKLASMRKGNAIRLLKFTEQGTLFAHFLRETDILRIGARAAAGNQ